MSEFSALLPSHDPDAIRRYCQTEDCETTWRCSDICPICGGPGTPGRTGHEPEGWPVTSSARLAILPGAAT